MKRLLFALCAYLATLTTPLFAAETKVANVAEFDAAVKAARPGDAIVLRDGEWRDAELVFRGIGESAADRRIMLRAETPGKAVLSGTSRLRIGGRFLTVERLHWKNTAATDATIAFRIDSKTFAEDCTLRECAIIDDEPTDEGDRKWVSIYGRRNRVEHCRFDGKQSAGTLMVVWLDSVMPADSQPEPYAHRIDFNFFGPREKLGKNGGETIRIGDSKTSLQRCETRVENNYFYRCDGEAEVISNKSCRNHYVGNTFIGCSGALTLRHGNDCRVYANLFDGDGRKGTGGVRVVGESHRVESNTFRYLRGDEVRAALCIMNGISETPLNGYAQVRGLVVLANRFLDCKANILVGFADKDRKNQTLPPVGPAFTRNIVVTNEAPVFTIATAPTEFAFFPNEFSGKLGLPPNENWTERDRQTLEKEFPNEVGEKQLADRLNEVGPAWLRPTEEFLPRDAIK